MSTARVAELNRQIAAKSAELVELLAGEESWPSNAPAPPPPPPPPWLSIEGFAGRLGISARTVRRMLAEGMPHKRFRKRAIRIPVAEAEAWIRKPERPGPLDGASWSVR